MKQKFRLVRMSFKSSLQQLEGFFPLEFKDQPGGLLCVLLHGLTRYQPQTHEEHEKAKMHDASF